MNTVTHESVSSSKEDFIVKEFTSQQTLWGTGDLLDTTMINGSRLWSHPTPVQTELVLHRPCALPQHPCAGFTSFQGEPVQCCPGMTLHLHGEKLTWIDLRSHRSIKRWPHFCHDSFVLRYSELLAMWPWGKILSHVGQMWNTCNSAGAH